MSIHPTAIIGPDVKLGESCEVGPYCIIDGPVTLGSGNRLISHVRIEGRTSIGDANTFFPFSSVGAIPQDLKYEGETSYTRLGSHNSIRECVTINRGTKQGNQSGEAATVLGDHNLIMAYTHVAHDCILGDSVVIANSTQLAGHVVIEDGARLGGANLVVQRVRIGHYAFTGAGVTIRKDIAPCVLGSGSVFEPSGINRVGLERAGFSKQAIEEIREAFRIYFASGLPHAEALAQLRAVDAGKEFKRWVKFVEESALGLHR